MGVTSHSVERLGSPFLMVDEMVFVVPRGSEVRLARQNFKVLFVLSGWIRHRIDGGEEREVGEGDVLVVPPVREHVYANPSAREARAHMLRLFLEPVGSGRGRRAARDAEEDLASFVARSFPAPLHLRSGLDPEMSAALVALRREAEERGPGYRHRVRAICTELIVLLARRTGPVTRVKNASGAAQVVGQALEFIQKHHSDPGLRLGAVAWHVGKGDEHLARLFKRETGRSVFDHVREQRIHHAKTLLHDPALSLTEIAERSGFASLAFFSRSFRKLTGMAPSAYRANLDLHVRPAADLVRLGATGGTRRGGDQRRG